MVARAARHVKLIARQRQAYLAPYLEDRAHFAALPETVVTR